jgi:hypothetical protein
MNKKSIIQLFSILLLVVILVSFKKMDNKPGRKSDPAPLLFWTSNSNYGPIEIFVDDVYKGDITMSYNGTPQCAAAGCVTVMITGTEWFTAQTRDGKFKWKSWQHTLTADVCNTEQLR